MMKRGEFALVNDQKTYVSRDATVVARICDRLLATFQMASLISNEESRRGNEAERAENSGNVRLLMPAATAPTESEITSNYRAATEFRRTRKRN